METMTYSKDAVFSASQNIKERDYWLDKLSGDIVKSVFKPDHKETGAGELILETTQLQLPEEICAKLLKLAKQSDYRLHIILTAALVLLLHKYTDSEDIVIGIPIYKQEVEGKLINTILALRNQVVPGISFKEFLLQVAQTVFAANENQNYPMEVLLDKLNMTIDDGFPLFDITLLLENIHHKEYIRHIPLNMIFSFLRSGETVTGNLEFNSQRYRRSTIMKIILHFTNLLTRALAHPDEKIQAIEIISGEEKQQLLLDFNDTGVEFPRDKTIPQLFTEQAEKSPHQTALSIHMDFDDIFADLISADNNSDLHHKYAGCCFETNPFIFKFTNPLLLNALSGLDKKEKEQMKLLLTHRRNYAAVNSPVRLLLDCFNGQDNLGSIFQGILDQDPEFRAVNFTRKDGPAILLEKKETIRINRQFAEFIRLIKVLYNFNLIRLVDYHPGLQELRVNITPPVGETRNEVAVGKEYSDAPVRSPEKEKVTALLLGDIVGTATIGILYLASYLRRNGIEAYCQWNDFNSNPVALEKNINRLLAVIQPQVVALSMKWFPHIARVLEICKMVKAYDASIKVVIGGNTASYFKKEIILYPCVDYVISGDGELPLLKICQGETVIPNCTYKEGDQVINTPITYVQDGINSRDIYLSHLEEIFVSPQDPFLAESFYINTGKGCSQNCFYCAGCRDIQIQSFNRKKPFLRDAGDVRVDIETAKPYVSTFMFDFDLILFHSLDYYERIWGGLDLLRHFCIFYSWELPSAEFLELVSGTFKYVYLNIDLCSLSESHRQKLRSLGLVKPQPSDSELFLLFNHCEKYENIEVKINQIAGLPYFGREHIKEGSGVLARFMEYSCFRGFDWGRLHAQPGAPLVENSDAHNMYSYARTFSDYLHYSQFNYEEEHYPDLVTLHYPYIYSKDDSLNSKISQYYFETNKKVEENEERKTKNLSVTLDISYQELDEQANRLAWYLQKKGVKSDSIVGVMLKPSLEMVTAILGILKAGGAFLPIDPKYPGERIQYVLSNSGIEILITDGSLPVQVRGLMQIKVNEALLSPGETSNPLKSAHPDSAAYVIYTSGTTGRPKGVVVDHRGVVNMLAYRKAVYGLNQSHTSLQLFSYAFDGFVAGFFTPIISGARGVLLNDRERLDISRIKDVITRYGVTHFISVPVLYRLIIENLSDQEAASLKAVTLAGDSLSAELLAVTRQKNQDLEIVNEYGVTEASVLSTLYRHQEKTGEISIGSPIWNTRVYILNKQDNLQPLGVAGELCIGGIGLARGYLNNPGLTNEKFSIINYKLKIKNGNCPPHGVLAPRIRRRHKIYKTGDLARWLPEGSGNIEFLGRVDHQVKIRGFRVELEEIRKRLLEYEEVKDAVVIARENQQGNRDLVAYYVEQKEKTKKPEFWPSVAEFFIYDELLYYAMAHDQRRINSYKAAIDLHVKDKIVVEIGTGRDAVLARLCVEAAAKKIYAIELLEQMANQAKAVVKEHGLQDKITVIHGDATILQLPEPADVCLSGIAGAIGGSEGAAVILNKARRLIKEDGIMIPGKSVNKIAAVILPGELRNHPRFNRTAADYVEKIFRSLGYRFDLRVCVKNFNESYLVSTIDEFEHLDFSRIVPEEAVDPINLIIQADSRIDGFLVWLNLHTVAGQMIDILKDEHCWLPVFLPVFYPGVVVSQGDKIDACCIRTLSENKINPDYKIKGKLIRKNRENIEFEYDFPHFEKAYRGHPFYQQLFRSVGQDNLSIESSGDLGENLRKHLSKMLPGYMVPTYFIPIDSIPLTASGKIHRQALPLPETLLEEEIVPPQNDLEKCLVKIWQKVLGRDNIGIHNNFFAIGGDSIKAIQISTRMNQDGYKVEIKDIFQNPTISTLTPYVTPIERISDQSAISGRVPLTPIQHWFFQQPNPAPHHFNQAVMLYLEQGFQEKAIEAIFLKLQGHHDALRMTYKKENGEIKQENRGMEHPLSLQVLDYRNRQDAISALETMAEEVQESIHLETGPLMKLALIHLEDGDRLLIVIHHLVVDVVSWHILLEDIETLYRQYNKKQKLKLPDKTDSYKLWAEGLASYSKSDLFKQEQSYWAGQEAQAKSIPPIKRDFEEGTNYLKDAKTLTFLLSEEESELLLTKTNQAFATEINDILLTALGLAIKKTFGNKKIAIAQEGHGREKILSQVNIERTVGWFTALYPVLLDLSNEDGEENLSRQIKTVKEILHRVPNRGIGYGIFRYLTPKGQKDEITFNLKPQISFNYMGQTDAETGGMTFAIAAESVGNMMNMEQEQETDIGVTGIMANKRLRISILYGKKQYKQETVETLKKHYNAGLKRIISYCVKQRGEQHTPVDFTYKQLSIEAVDRLSGQYDYNIKDIYPLSPMQEGLLFYALYKKNSSMGFLQTSYRLQGTLDIFLVEKSLNELFKRHDVLRTAIIFKQVELPLQLVLKDRKVDFSYKDLRGMTSPEEKETFIKEFKEKNRLRSFDLSQDVLMRVKVIRMEDSTYEFTWSVHHIVLDGWCIGILISEFFEIYNSLLANGFYRLPPPVSYQAYIQWLEKKDKNKSAEFWKEYLAGYEEPAHIPQKKAVNTLEQEIAVLSIFIDKTKTNRLQELAKKARVTLNVVMQSIWAIILGKYNNKHDVVFGVVVSGRPSEIKGVESIVGLFINTVPVRIRTAPGTRFTQLLQRVQEDAVTSEPHHHYSLAKIQSENPLKHDLFDHLLSFENYPIDEKIDELIGTSEENERGYTLEVSRVDSLDPNNYDFEMLICPRYEQLLITFSYNKNVYDTDHIEKIAAHIEEVVEQILENDTLTCKDIEISYRSAAIPTDIYENESEEFGF